MSAKVQSRTTEERFWSQVEKTDGCWLWAGPLKPNGYAHFYPGGGRHVAKIYVHRFAFAITFGPAPDGYEIDHLCHVRHCVNPAHLEAVTKRENLDRRNVTNGWSRMRPAGMPRVLKTHCKLGHAFDEENTYLWGGYRYCKTCRRDRGRLR